MKALYSLILFTSIAAPSSALQGGDSCSSPTAISGVGTFNFDCTSATTGADGQGEGLCYAFGSTAVDLDVWFEDGIDTPGLVMIHVRAERIHYWDGKDDGEVIL